ncbi:MAG: serine/threonine-protein kinase, partial [Myxococcota bacterium]|nr:serine/threonine-protein kinase [Myxococcota bacterium]
MIYCGHCRAENTEGNRFCVGCGADLEAQRTTTAPEPGASGSGADGATRLEPTAHGADLAPGSLLDRDRYRLDSVLGTGGMGTVYRATDLKLGQVVALKIIHGHLLEGTTGIERLRNEVSNTRELHHPGIVRVYDLGSDEGREFFTMELVEGPTLREFLEERSEPLSLEEAKTVLLPLLDALTYAHGQTVHRDVKPENVLLAGGELSQPRLVDFGIAKTIEGETLTRTALALGTPHYMAPEQVETPLEVDHRADLYSVGVMLYELVTGERPGLRSPLPSEVTSELPEALDHLVDQLFQPRPADRPESAAEVKAALEAMQAAPAVEAESAPEAREEETPGDVPDERVAWPEPVEVSMPSEGAPPVPPDSPPPAERPPPAGRPGGGRHPVQWILGAGLVVL